MIASLTGRVAQVGLDHAVINVNGFGMLVYATARTLSKLRTGEEATVLTTMIVREESMTLYGFSEPAEREVFDMMLSVSGIGPRIALAVLSVHTAAEVERAEGSRYRPEGCSPYCAGACRKADSQRWPDR